MEFTMEWNIICRVCLQEGEMHSVFEKDEDILISDKIMHCCSVKIERGVNLPENICEKCLKNLRIAYTFRSNCENSDAVLQSFAKGNIVNDLVISANGELYKYKPPQGLKVKRIPKQVIKSEKALNDENAEIEITEKMSEGDESFDERENIETISSHRDDQNSLCGISLKSDKDETNSQDDDDNNLVVGQDYMVIDDGTNIYTVKVDDDNENEAMTVLNTGTEKSITNINNHEKKFSILKPKLKPLSKSSPVTIPRQKGRSEKPMHICEICGNSYKHRHSLETHMRRHRNEKPFSCEICGRAFVLNVELKCHMRTHTGQKPYPCRFCGRCFSDFGSRIKHERTHTGERPYACETCGKAFAYSYGLTSHMLTHTGEKPFECEKCGKRFAKKHHLKNHLNTHAKQESRNRIRGPIPPPNIIVNTSNSGIGSSEDEYSSMLTVLTNEQNMEQCMERYMNVNVIGIKQEDQNSVTDELADMNS